MPVVIDVTITPTASAPVEMRAIAASPLSLPFSFIAKSAKAARMTIGIEKYSGAMLAAQAMASAPNPTWERPSPIMENRLSTRLTPSSAQHSEIRPPTTSARSINAWENRNESVSSMIATSRKRAVDVALQIVLLCAEKRAALLHV